MSKGIVLELRGKEAILLTPEGDFRAIKRSKRREWLIGEEVDLPPVHLPQIRMKRKKFIPSIALAASILLVFISLFAYTLLGGGQTAIAYVNVDINPSVEMSIDKHVKVINMIGINQEGEKIILLMEDWSGQPLDQVTINLIMAARQQGYMTENQNILVSTSFVDDESEGMYTASIDSAMHEVERNIIASTQIEKKSHGDSSPDNELSLSSTDTDKDQEEEVFHIHRMKTKKEDHKEAKELGISPGKYSIYLAAVGQGIEIELDEVTGSSIAVLTQRLNGVGSILSNKPENQKQGIKEEKEEKAEQKKQEKQENKGSQNNQQQNDKAQQNKKDQKVDKEKDQKQAEDDIGKGNSNKPRKPEVPGTPEKPDIPKNPSSPKKGLQDKKEKIVDEVKDSSKELMRQFERELPTIPGIIRTVPGIGKNDRTKKNNGKGIGKSSDKGNN